MSTILDALQKQKSPHSDYFQQSLATEKKLLTWQRALFAALLLIICLLTFLLYTQLLAQENDVNNQLSSTLHKSDDLTEKIASAVDLKNSSIARQPVVEKVLKSSPVEFKSVKKMTFNTEPLPLEQIAEQVDTPIVNQPVSSIVNNNAQDKIDYSAVSNDLQRRFELALLDIPAQQTVSPPAINQDGSDIHDMSAEFQQKVPSIRYDAHLYSTTAGERWIKVNGENLKEGQFDKEDEIQLLKIQPNRSIFRVGRQSFSLESLTDWKGY